MCQPGSRKNLRIIENGESDRPDGSFEGQRAHPESKAVDCAESRHLGAFESDFISGSTVTTPHHNELPR